MSTKHIARKHNNMKKANGITDDVDQIGDISGGNNDVEFSMDLKEPAPTAPLTKQQKDASVDVEAIVDEYENEIERLENLNATLTANVATLTAAALDGENGSVEQVQIVDVAMCQHCAARSNGNDDVDHNIRRSPDIIQRQLSNITPNEDDTNNYDDDDDEDDMILTEEHYISKISKLQKANNKLDKRLEHKKKLVSQLSLNLKTAAEKISEVGKERDEWKAKYQQLEQATKSSAATSHQQQEDIASMQQTHNYQTQVIENELSSLLHIMDIKKRTQFNKRQQLLNGYRSDDAIWNQRMERPEDTLQRVIRHLRSGEDDTAADVAASSKEEDETAAPTSVWDSVTSIFGSSNKQKQEQLLEESETEPNDFDEQMYEESCPIEGGNVSVGDYNDEVSQIENTADNVGGRESDAEDEDDNCQTIESIQPDIAHDEDMAKAPQAIEVEAKAPQATEEEVTNDVTNGDNSIEEEMSPQDYFISILQARGYPVTTYSSLKCGYYNKPTIHQTVSYGVALTKAIRSSDIDTVCSLLNAGFHPNACNDFGESIIHAACRRGDYTMIQTLLEAGASVQVVDDFGRVPLHDAFWTASPNLDTVRLLLDQDPWLLCLEDTRGSTPLDYVRKEHWDIWIDFLRDTADHYWPNLNEFGEGSEHSGNNHGDTKTVPPLTLEDPNSCPLPEINEHIDLEVVRQLANGNLTPEDLHKREDTNLIENSDDGGRQENFSDTTEKRETNEAGLANDIPPHQDQMSADVDSVKCSNNEQESVDETENQDNTTSFTNNGDDSSQTTEEPTTVEYELFADNPDRQELVDKIMGRCVDNLTSKEVLIIDEEGVVKEGNAEFDGEDILIVDELGIVQRSDEESEDEVSLSSNVCADDNDSTAHLTEHVECASQNEEHMEHNVEVEVCAEIDESSIGEMVEKGHDYDKDSEDDDYVAKEPKDDGSDEEEELDESDATYPVISHTQIEDPKAINSHQQHFEDDKAANDGSQKCLVDDDETLNELSDMPTSITLVPRNYRSDASTVITSVTTATALTEGTQARITAAIEDKGDDEFITSSSNIVTKNNEKADEQKIDETSDVRSLDCHNSVASQFTASTKQTTKDEKLTNRLSRSQLFKLQGSLGLLKETILLPDESTQSVLVTSIDNDKYLVPPYEAPSLPLESDTREAQTFRKGMQDGFYTYQSSSGNSYHGLWKDGRRHGTGIATYREGEIYHGLWQKGRRHGHGVLHLAANKEVFEGVSITSTVV